MVLLLLAAVIGLIAITASFWLIGNTEFALHSISHTVLLLVVAILALRLYDDRRELGESLRHEETMARLDASLAREEFNTTFEQGPAAAFAPVADLFPCQSVALTIVDASRMKVLDHFATGNDRDLLSPSEALGPAKEAEGGTDGVRRTTRPGRMEELVSITCSQDKLVAVIRLASEPKNIAALDGKDVDFLSRAGRYILNHVSARVRERERELMQQRLEHAERLQAIGTVTGGVAHEFNNILVAMLGFAEMASNAPNKRSAGPHLENVIKAGHRARTIVDQILSMSRKSERIIKPVNLRDSIGASEALIRISLPARIALHIDNQDPSMTIDGNPIEIQHILMNLCRNAAQAIEQSGTIRIVVSNELVNEFKIVATGVVPPGQYARISVADSGRGIAESNLPQIFEPFFTTKANRGGTGLGLSTVATNVNALGGFIDVSSAHGTGSCFDIYLPVSTKKAVSLSSFFSSDHVPLGSGELVAVICNDQTTREMYEDKIAALGYEPNGFGSCIRFEAWRNKGKTADAVLLDVGNEVERALVPHALKGIDSRRLIAIGSSADILEGRPGFHLGHPLSSQALAEALCACVNHSGLLSRDLN